MHEPQRGCGEPTGQPLAWQRADKLRLRLAGESFRGRAGSSLAVGRRTIARGETSVSAGPQKTGTVEIQFDVPAVKQGVVMPAVLSVACYAPNASTPAASLEKTLWIFPEDPFVNRSQWLKQLRIHLFDPVGKTRQVFEDTGIPFSQTDNVDSLSTLKEGLLVIGEGTSLEEYLRLRRVVQPLANNATAHVAFPTTSQGRHTK